MNNSYTKRTFARKTIQTQSAVLEIKHCVDRRFSTAKYLMQSLEAPKRNARHKFRHTSVHTANQHTHGTSVLQIRHARHWPVNSRTQCNAQQRTLTRVFFRE
jgi:hypothetical protein